MSLNSPPHASSILPSTSTITSNVNHMTRVLSTATGLESILATACYTSLFLHTQAPHFTGGFPRASARIPTGSLSLKALYDYVEDHRTFSRLFGLFPLYTTFVEAWRKPHRDPVVKTLLYASLATSTVFQALENVALLTQRGILRGEGLRRREGWYWVISYRFYLATLGFEMLRLARVRQLKFREELGAEKVDEDEEVWAEERLDASGDVAESTQQLMEISTRQLVKVQSAELEKRWWRELYVNVLSLPLAVHLSFNEGTSPVSEALWSACGLLAGVIGLQDAWEEAA